MFAPVCVSQYLGLHVLQYPICQHKNIYVHVTANKSLQANFRLQNKQ